MTKQESAALNMAKFIRAQSLLLLEKLDVLDLALLQIVGGDKLIIPFC